MIKISLSSLVAGTKYRGEFEERLEAHHGVALGEAALRAAVEWSVRYLPDFRLPDKALDLVDQACAVVRFATLSPQEPRGVTPRGRPGARRSSHNG